MKNNRIIKRFLACGLAVAMTFTAVSIVPATVNAAKKTAKKSNKKSKKASKKKSSKNTKTLAVGKKLTLKVKKASKKVKWTVNKKNIVKVVKLSGKKKDKATIKGLKQGKAVVTAKVGKKKTKWNINVSLEKPKIKSVSIDKYDDNCVIVELKKKLAMNVTDFDVFVKDFSDGKFIKEAVIVTMTTEAQKTYRLYLDSGLSNGDYVKVVARGVSKQTQNKEIFHSYGDEEIFIEVGKEFSFDLDELFDDGIGNELFSLDGDLLEGLEYNEADESIYGVVTKAGETTINVKAVDEIGRVANAKIVLKAYDENTVVANNGVIDLRIDDAIKKEAGIVSEANKSLPDSEKRYLSSLEITPYGGSEGYTYTLDTPDNAEVCLSKNEDGRTQINIPYSITEGKHVYTITVADAMNAARTCKSTVTVNVVTAYNVTGTIKDERGNELSSGEVLFIPEDANGLDDAAVAMINNGIQGDEPGIAAGTYAIALEPGTYTVKVNRGSVLYLVEKKIKVGKADIVSNIVVPARLNTVSGQVAYANEENKISYVELGFVLKELKYEYSNFNAYTNLDGNFIASLPDGEYEVFFYDEVGKRQYLDKTIVVNGSDINVGVLKASITRYLVQGVVYNGTVVKPETGNNPVLDYTEMYFYDENGRMMYVETDEMGIYHIYLEGGDAPGKTYKVRAYFAGAERTLGTITVTNENQTNKSFKYTFESEIAEAKAVEVDKKISLVSTGNNDLICKIVVPDDGDYTLNVNNELYNLDTYVFDQNGHRVVSEYTTNVISEMTDLKKGEVYYVKVIPYDGGQRICTFDFLFEKYRTPQEKAVVIPVGGSMPVTSSYEGTTFIKLSLEENKTYELSFEQFNQNSDVEECAFRNYGTDGESSVSGNQWVYEGETYQFSVDTTGDYYIRVRYYDWYGDRTTATARIKFVCLD